MISFELAKEIEKFFFRFSTSAGTKNRGLRVESNLRIRILSSDALPLIHRYTSYDEEGGLLRSSYMTRVLQIFPFVPPPPALWQDERNIFLQQISSFWKKCQVKQRGD